jgi:hypothetical protein
VYPGLPAHTKLLFFCVQHTVKKPWQTDSKPGRTNTTQVSIGRPFADRIMVGTAKCKGFGWRGETNPESMKLSPAPLSTKAGDATSPNRNWT